MVLHFKLSPVLLNGVAFKLSPVLLNGVLIPVLLNGAKDSSDSKNLMKGNIDGKEI